MKIFTLSILAFLGVVGANPVTAAAKAIKCDACTYQQKTHRVKFATSSGVVYVFDAANVTVDKFRVYNHTRRDNAGNTGDKVVRRLTAEHAIKSSYVDYIEAVVEARLDHRVVLDDDLPIRSIAGAQFDQQYVETAVESALMQLPVHHNLWLRLNKLVATFFQIGIPAFDIPPLVEGVIVTVVFPDGSTGDYRISFVIDPLGDISRMEVEYFGNARMPDGRPMPTSRWSFRGLTFNDKHGALPEWIAWARELGASLYSGPDSDKPYMTCSVGQPMVCKYYQP